MNKSKQAEKKMSRHNGKYFYINEIIFLSCIFFFAIGGSFFLWIYCSFGFFFFYFQCALLCEWSGKYNSHTIQLVLNLLYRIVVRRVVRIFSCVLFAILLCSHTKWLHLTALLQCIGAFSIRNGRVSLFDSVMWFNADIFTKMKEKKNNSTIRT